MLNLSGLFGKFKREQERYGMAHALRRTIAFIANPTYAQFDQEALEFGTVNFTKELNRWNNKPLSRSSQKKLKINWVIPDMEVGNSGGHMNIFCIARQLELRGHDQHFYIYGRSKFSSGEQFKEAVRSGFQLLNCSFSIGINNLRACDALIATGWQTAYPVYQNKNAQRKFYFVQDYEPWFYPMGSNYVLAKNTYHMGLIGIVNGPWLKKVLEKNFKMQCYSFSQAFDREAYYYLPNAKRDENLVLHYARPYTTRRGWELALTGLKILKERRPQTKIYLYGADLAGIAVPFEHKSLGILTGEQLGALYRRAATALVCSLTNYSIVPQELMACGCPFVDLKSQTTLGVFNDQEDCLLAPAHPHAIALTLEKMLTQPKLRQKLAQSGLQRVKHLTWEKVGANVEEILLSNFK